MAGDSRVLEVILRAKDEMTKQLGDADSALNNTSLKVAAAGAAMLGAGIVMDKALDSARDSAVSYGKEIINLQRLTGLSAEESSKFVAVFQRYGIEGAKVGVIVKKLSGEISGHSEALAAAGIATQDANGNNRDAMAVMADLAEYYKNADDKTQAVALASKVLGKGYMDLLPILAGGKDAINGITEAAEKNGAIYSQAELDKIKAYGKVQADNKAATEAMTREIGLATLPFETFKAQVLSQVIAKLQEMSPLLGSSAVGLAAVAAEGLKLGGSFLLMVPGINAIIGWFSAGGILAGAGSAIAAFFASIGSALATGWGVIASSFTSVFSGLGAAIAEFFAGGGLVSALASFATWVAGLTGAAAAAAVTIAVALGVALGVGIDAAMRAIFPNYQQWWNDMLQPVFDFIDSAGAAIGEFGETVGAWLSDAWDTVRRNTGDLWNDIVLGMSDLPGRFQGALVGVATFMSGWAKTVWGGVTKEFDDGVGNLVKNIGAWLSDAWNTVRRGADDLWNDIVLGMRDLPGRFRGALVGVATFMSGWAKTVWDGVTKGFDDGVGNLVKNIKSLPENIEKLFNTWLFNLVKIGHGMVDGIWKGIAESWDDFMVSWNRAIGNMITFIRKLLHMESPSKVFADIGMNISAGLAQGIAGGQAGVDRAIGSLVTMPRGSYAYAGGGAVSGGAQSVHVYLDGIELNRGMATVSTGASRSGVR